MKIENGDDRRGGKKKKAFGEYCCRVDFHLRPHIVPRGRKAVFLERKVQNH